MGGGRCGAEMGVSPLENKEKRGFFNTERCCCGSALWMLLPEHTQQIPPKARPVFGVTLLHFFWIPRVINWEAHWQCGTIKVEGLVNFQKTNDICNDSTLGVKKETS